MPKFLWLMIFGFALATEAGNMLELHTTAFPAGGTIPKRFTCSGNNDSPALSWSSAPGGTKSFALIVDDPDAPSGTFTHWLLYNIPAASRGISEAVPNSEQLPDGSRQGRNGFGRVGYGGPCPPPGKSHRYFFRLFALDTILPLQPGVKRSDLDQAIKNHIVAKAEWMGTYER